MSWLRIRELVRKEFIQLFRDKKVRPLLIIAPFLQLLIFGYVLSTEVKDVRVGVVDQARTREPCRHVQSAPEWTIDERIWLLLSDRAARNVVA